MAAGLEKGRQNSQERKNGPTVTPDHHAGQGGRKKLFSKKLPILKLFCDILRHNDVNTSSGS
jgi:hypothetical protein